MTNRTTRLTVGLGPVLSVLGRRVGVAWSWLVLWTLRLSSVGGDASWQLAQPMRAESQLVASVAGDLTDPIQVPTSFGDRQLQA